MRRVVVGLAIGGCALLAAAPPCKAAGWDGTTTGTPGAGIVDGTPTAVVVQGPAGELASYHGPGRGPSWHCVYHPLISGPDGALLPDIDGPPAAPEAGRAYGFLCYDQTGALVSSRNLIYDPGDPLAGIAAAERAAAIAADQLPLDPPRLELSPPAEVDQLVGLPTWLWVDNPWQPDHASATIGTVTSTATATPTKVTYDLGDGTTLSCAPGTPYDPGRPARDQTSDCTHTYTTNGTRPVTATIAWDVTWTATTGAGGALGTVTRTTTIPVHVVEAQAVVR